MLSRKKQKEKSYIIQNLYRKLKIRAVQHVECMEKSAKCMFSSNVGK